MKNTKTLLAAALIAACTISQPVLAADVTESATLPALNTLALESTDLAFAFEQTSQPLQMATLSEQEMKETEGARSPWGAVADVWRNTNFDGYNANTGRIAQIRYNGPPVFRLDYAPNPSPSMLHVHFFNESFHRPWYAPWQKY